MTGNLAILTDQIMKALAIVIVSGVLAVKLSHRTKLPDTVLFIIIGILTGPEILGFVSFQSFPAANQFILTFGASYILYDGGREIHLKVLNKVKVSVVLLATVGVIISAFITGYFAEVFLHLNFLYGLLLGSVIASTDPSVLVPLFKKMNISAKLKQTIISESAFNDAAGAIVTFAVLGIVTGGAFSLSTSLFELLKTAGGGISVGGVIGFISLFLVSEHRFGFFDGHKAEMAVAAVLGAYFVATYFGVSGFMAVFVVGIVFGNKMVLNLSIEEESQNLHLSFKDVLVNLLRIMIFVILGTQVDFGVVATYWQGALLVVLLFMFVARPVSVLVSVVVDRKAHWNWREIVYLMWTRETGVIPAALAGMLVSMQIPQAEIVSSVTFMAILITISLQASTAKLVARLLNLEENGVAVLAGSESETKGT